MLKVVFYLFLVYIAVFLIFINVNPIGTNITKGYILEKIGCEYNLNSKLIKSLEDLKNIKFPSIFKPDVCSGNNRGVFKVNNKEEAIKILKEANELYISQDFYDSEYEAMVLYEKHPFQKKGNIVSIVLKQIPKKWKPLRCKTILSKDEQKLTNCFLRNDLITDKLEKKIRNISDKLPNFYAGRYDIRFSNLDDFKNGINFKVIELNGVMGYDGRYIVNPFYYIIRWFLIRILIGLQNIILLNCHNILNIPKIFVYSWKTFIRCKDIDKLFEPSSL